MKEGNAAESAIRKLEQFYNGLQPDERKIIGLIVSSSLQRAARAQTERAWLVDAEILLKLIAPGNAPNLVADLGTFVAGQMGPQLSEKRPLT
jgi:hypothetical protein